MKETRLPAKLKIDVTQDDLDNGDHTDPCQCSTSLAVRKALSKLNLKPREVIVTIQLIKVSFQEADGPNMYVYKIKSKDLYTFPWHDSAQRGKIEPTSFLIELQ